MKARNDPRFQGRPMPKRREDENFGKYDIFNYQKLSFLKYIIICIIYRIFWPDFLCCIVNENESIVAYRPMMDEEKISTKSALGQDFDWCRIRYSGVGTTSD